MPPAATPRMATAMITTNSGIDTAIAGSVELKGSNDTVTKWRLATAKTMKMRPKRNDDQRREELSHDHLSQ